MGRAFVTEVLRSVRGSLGRFIAIVVIVAIGCGFFAGLRMTGVGMRKSADAFWDGTRYFDLELVSTLGLSNKTVEDVASTPGVSAAMPSRSVDVMASFGDEQYACRITTLPASVNASSSENGVEVASADNNYLNRLVLRSGRWPTKPDECVLLEERAEHTGRVKSVHVLYGSTDLDGTLAERDFTVVGYASSPLYTSSALLGVTTLGSGQLQQAMFVPEGAFDADAPYTELFLAVDGARGEITASPAYEQTVGAVESRLQERLDAIANARRDEVRADAQKEIDDGRAEYETERADALAKLDDAKAELDEASKKLDDGQAELDENRALLEDKAREIANGRAQWREGADKIAAERSKLEEGEAQLEEGQRTLDDKRAELEEGEAQWKAGSRQLADKRAEYEQGLAAWEQQDSQNRPQAEAAIAQLTAQRDQLEAQKAQLDQAHAAGLVDDASYQTQSAAIVRGLEQVNAGIEQAQAGIEALDSAKAQLDAAAAQLRAGEQELAKTKAQLDEGKAKLAEGQKELDENRGKLAAGREQLEAGQAELDANKTKLDDGESQIAAGRTELENGQAELDKGRTEYEDGLSTYNRERSDALEKLDDAKKKLDDAQAEVDDIESPDLFVLDRTQNHGSESFRSDSMRIDNIATAFPFFFFLVAALVSLTTMTRMVEDDRGLIGTYKALGYSTLTISAKYLAYAGAASVLGALVGILSMSQLLPAVIFDAYGIIYNIPARPFPLPVEPVPALTAAGLGIGITLAATLGACLSTLRESPARLMQPKAPKAGKRILLERIAPVWSRMSFSWKVTMRNIFRYKRRFFMTVIGIAGCTGLLLTGFGVRDSINDIIDKQFGELFAYNTTVGLSSEATTGQVDDVVTFLEGTGKVSDLVRLSSENMLVKDPSNDKNVSVQVIVPADEQEFSRLVHLRERVGGKKIELGQDGAVLSEKLANTLGAKVGDKVPVFRQDDAGNPKGAPHEVTVTGVTENYLGSYLYLGPGAYEESFGPAPRATTIYAVVAPGEDVRKGLAEDLQQLPEVDTVMFNDETIDSYRNMLKSVDSVMVVLIVAAALLAFVVLYNLANINISERVREIASLKVLGFTPREVDAYVFREIFLIVVVGALIGLGVGVLFEGYVIVTAEVDGAMFGREIHWPSYLYAFGLTLAFCGLVLLTMRPKLASIDMVESLKSVE